MHPIDSGYRAQLIQEDRHRQAAVARKLNSGLSTKPNRQTWSIRLTWPRRQGAAEVVSAPGADC